MVMYGDDDGDGDGDGVDSLIVVVVVVICCHGDFFGDYGDIAVDTITVMLLPKLVYLEGDLPDGYVTLQTIHVLTSHCHERRSSYIHTTLALAETDSQSDAQAPTASV